MQTQPEALYSGLIGALTSGVMKAPVEAARSIRGGVDKGGFVEDNQGSGSWESQSPELADGTVDGFAEPEWGKTLSAADAEEYAFNAIKGPDKADAVVLGKFDALKDPQGAFVLDANGNRLPSENSYNTIAKDIGAQYFELDNWNELASQYSEGNIWKINERFLDIQTSAERPLYLANNPAEFLGDGSFYSKEIQYLLDNGYEFIREGDLWHAVR